MENNIKKYRVECNLSQKDISDALKKIDPRIDVSMVSRFESGVCLPTDEVADALCDLLQATKNELWGKEYFVPVNEPFPCEVSAEIARIVAAVPYGKSNAVTREALCEMLGLGDREIRRRITMARRAGIIIINDQDGAGYYQSDDLDVLERQYKQDTSRALAILARRKHIRKVLIDAGINV